MVRKRKDSDCKGRHLFSVAACATSALRSYSFFFCLFFFIDGKSHGRSQFTALKKTDIISIEEVCLIVEL